MTQKPLRRRSTIKIASTLAALSIAASIAAPTANAESDYDIGCEYIKWGFLGSQMRTICDGPRRPDGSWQRGRLISIPSHTLPARTTCSGTYSVTCTYREKQDVDMKIIEKVFYDLTDGAARRESLVGCPRAPR